jgi:hypothetical protein
MPDSVDNVLEVNEADIDACSCGIQRVVDLSRRVVGLKGGVAWLDDCDAIGLDLDWIWPRL